MSKQRINVGTGINTGTGDTLRAAMEKVNNNFDELYDLAGQDSTGKAIDISGSTISSTFTNTDITISPNGTGNVVIDGDLVTNIIKSDDSTAVIIDDNLTLTGTLTADALSLGDDEKVNLGASNDLQLYHDSTFNNSVINNVNGHLIIRNDLSNTTKDVFIQSDNDVKITSIGDGETFAKFSDDAGVELYFDNVKKFETTSTGATVTGIFNIGDGGVSDNYIGLGAANDLKIFHNGSHSIVRETGTGNLFLQSDNNVILSKDTGTETMVKAIADGAVELYHDNTKTFETTATGVSVTGNIDVSGATVFTPQDDLATSTTALSLSKTVHSLAAGEQNYTLAAGTEGQIMHFIIAGGDSVAGSVANTTVTISQVRNPDDGDVLPTYAWKLFTTPFGAGDSVEPRRSLATCIFGNGAWNLDIYSN